jgi:Bacterial low temperature requirement A protein (LtrA)
VSDAEREPAGDAEHQVTPLELFFDLAFVFAITQVTRMLADDPTWAGVLRGMLVLAAIWWAWEAYAWLTSATDVDEGGVRLVMLAATGAMLFVALAVPGAFGDDALLFAIAYFLVRTLHLVLSGIVARDDPERRGAILRFSPTALVGASLLVVASFLDGDARITVWIVALSIDYLGPVVIGVGRGWRVAPEHFAERHGLIVLIALGESIDGRRYRPLRPRPEDDPRRRRRGARHGARVRAVRRRRAVPGRARRVPLPNDGRIFRRRTIRALVLVARFPVALAIPALAALASSAQCARSSSRTR